MRKKQSDFVVSALHKANVPAAKIDTFAAEVFYATCVKSADVCPTCKWRCNGSTLGPLDLYVSEVSPHQLRIQIARAIERAKA